MHDKDLERANNFLAHVGQDSESAVASLQKSPLNLLFGFVCLSSSKTRGCVISGTSQNKRSKKINKKEEKKKA